MRPRGCRVGMAQMLVEGGRPEPNLERAAERVAQAAAKDCGIVVLPECLDLGWTHPSARELAQPIPGPHSERLAQAARAHAVHVVAGLVERAGDRRYNAAVLIGPGGELLLHYRKINELDIALGLYGIGDRLGVARTEWGTLGVNICADNFEKSLAIGHVLARMGAQLILSPCAWAVDADHDNEKDPYGKPWREAYAELARLYEVAVIGVSNVGWLEEGPWAGRKAIGSSLAVGPGGEVLAQGSYGEEADELLCVDVTPRPRRARGTQMAGALRAKGYRGP